MSTFDRHPAFRREIAQILLLTLDVGAGVAALLASCLLTLPGAQLTLPQLLNALPVLLLTTAVASGVVFYVAGLNRRFWRFVSIADLLMIVAAAAVATTISYVLALAILPGDRLPAALFILHWLSSIAAMSGMRVVCRFGPQALAAAQGFGRQSTRSDAKTALLAGPPDAVDAVLRKVESGVINEFIPVGILDETDADVSRILRGVPILGRLEGLPRILKDLRNKGTVPQQIVIAAKREVLSNPRYISLASDAAKLEIPVSHAWQVGDDADNAPVLREFDMSELLGRPSAQFDSAVISRALHANTILVTGAGGSIGGELVRQIAGYKPEKLILVDSSEYNLYNIDLELRENFQDVSIEACLCDIRDRRGIFKIVESFKPELIFHAAALKHVPLVELNPSIGATTNVFGTKNVADAVKKFGVKAMVQVSTDKAVNPIGIMGATKRLGEIYCQSLDADGKSNSNAPRFMTVRFGNVLGSSGSVVPLFNRQLRERVPLTVTHPDMTRYFMTIHEAVSLVLQTTQYAFEKDIERGLVFVLDMGKPIRIVDMANRMIRLSGLNPNVDVEIKYVGIRAGEKLHETLFDENEEILPSRVPGIFEAHSKTIDPAILYASMDRLEVAASNHHDEEVRSQIMDILSTDTDVSVVSIPNKNSDATANDGVVLARNTEEEPAAYPTLRPSIKTSRLN